MHERISRSKATLCARSALGPSEEEGQGLPCSLCLVMSLIYGLSLSDFLRVDAAQPIAVLIIDGRLGALGLSASPASSPPSPVPQLLSVSLHQAAYTPPLLPVSSISPWRSVQASSHRSTTKSLYRALPGVAAPEW